MEYFIGIDGGGTKTQFILVDAIGRVIGRRRGEGSSYKETSALFVGELLRREVAALVRDIDSARVMGIFFAMPCYGESVPDVALGVTETIRSFLEPFPVAFQNDVEAAWAGAFALQEDGICILSGTGSMAITRTPSGDIARAGGWSEVFSDEGSCYWLGLEALRLFTRQADGRLPRGPLYAAMRQYFPIQNDFEIIDIVHHHYVGCREKMARLQLVLHAAALQGDVTCRDLYTRAARELADMALSLRHHFPDVSVLPVSYAGGLFRAGQVILEPLRQELQGDGRFRLVTPMLSPAEGAALLAVEAFRPELVQTVRAGLSPHITSDEKETA